MISNALWKVKKYMWLSCAKLRASFDLPGYYYIFVEFVFQDFGRRFRMFGWVGV